MMISEFFWELKVQQQQFLGLRLTYTFDTQHLDILKAQERHERGFFKWSHHNHVTFQNQIHM